VHQTRKKDQQLRRLLVTAANVGSEWKPCQTRGRQNALSLSIYIYNARRHRGLSTNEIRKDSYIER
jgi:hypothetical protein